MSEFVTIVKITSANHIPVERIQEMLTTDHFSTGKVLVEQTYADDDKFDSDSTFYKKIIKHIIGDNT